MSGRSSPVNGGYEAASTEPAMRLTVRKDLFPDVRLPKLGSVEGEDTEDTDMTDELETVSYVNLETDFEQSIDAIAKQKHLILNGAEPSPTRPRHKKHKQHSKRDAQRSTVNGSLPPEKKRRNSPRESHHRTSHKRLQVKGGKNLNLVSSSECQDEDVGLEEDSDSSDDEVLKCSVKLPLVMPRQSGKPYSHELSQLSTKKTKSKNSHKEKRAHAVTPCSGKPRSMLDICSSRSKKKSKKSECTATYRSQIVDTNTNIKIKIKRTSVHETITPTPTSIADLGQRKSKKKRAASPVDSESSGEEYDPSRGDTAAAMSVGVPKPRNTRSKPTPPPKARKTKSSTPKTTSKTKSKCEKTEKSRVSEAVSKNTGPQSPWADTIPEEILEKIFEDVVNSQGTLPAVIRLGRVCKRWHNVSCRPELWKNIDIAQYTREKCKTDYKLVWLLENRLSKCQSLNIAEWKVSNISWVLACVVDYCPDLVELNLAGWNRMTPEQLFELVQGLNKLQRLDLSLTSETGGSGTCLSAASVSRLMENFGSRLTHLTLANNKFTALPQILSSVAAHCVNLEVLDISGAQATSHPAAVPLEDLQKGCPKMRVFRAANSQLVLVNLPRSKKLESPGWTQLEELSIAGEAAAERESATEYRLGDDELSRLVRDATRLRLLDLRGLNRLTDSGLVRVPAWDLQHLFLGGSKVTRQNNGCLELICEKWSHSLIELDLSWASAARVLDDAICALADSPSSKLRTLNLCGSSVSLESVKKVLMKCTKIESLNLSSCRALPRGMKRLYTGKELQDLKDSFDPVKVKAKEQEELEKANKKKDKKTESDSKTERLCTEPAKQEQTGTSNINLEMLKDDSSSFQEPKQISDSNKTPTQDIPQSPLNIKSNQLSSKKDVDGVTMVPEGQRSTRDTTPKLLSPIAQSKPDSSSTSTSELTKIDMASPHYSPLPKPDSQVQNSPEVQSESLKSSNSSWNLGQFRTTPTHKSEASPLNRLESHTKSRAGKEIEQCSPTTSLQTKQSPETTGTAKQDIKNPSSWNYGSYSPMPRQDTQFSSQRSPYSAQPSPAQPSPYSTQPSPYSTQPSPYSSQPSPYSAQPSPDTSQMVKPDIQKSWNTGNFSPMPKHHAPFSPHPSTHTSPDPGIGVKSDNMRSNTNKTTGQYSPMSRQDRIHQSPYSPRTNVENVAYSNKKSPASVGNFSPMMRPDCHLPSPDGGQQSRSVISGRSQDMYNRTLPKVPDLMQSIMAEIPTSWPSVDRFNQISNVATAGIESLIWGTSSFGSEPVPPRIENIPDMLNTPPPNPSWTGLPFDNSVRRPNEDISDSWTLGQFRVEPPQQTHNTFVDQNVNFDSMNLGHAAHVLQNYLDEGFTERSRVD